MAIGTRFRDIDPRRMDKPKRGRMIIYAAGLLILLIKIADWIAPYENLTEDGCVLDYVYDGDTVAISCDGALQTVRLVGFDTPEARDARCPEEKALADKATQRLRQIAKGREVTFSGEDTDKYDRLLVTMRVDGEDVGDLLIDEGLAVAYDGGRRISWCAKLGG